MQRQGPAAPVVTIGQLASATGVTPKTIRYYEAIGLLPPPRRSAGGYRQYDQPAIDRLRFIRRARALGLPLGELKTLVATFESARRPGLRPRLLAVVRAQLATVRDRSAELRLLRQHLEQTLHRLLKPAPAPHPGPCRCLEIDDGNRRAARPTARRRVRPVRSGA